MMLTGQILRTTKMFSWTIVLAGQCLLFYTIIAFVLYRVRRHQPPKAHQLALKRKLQRKKPILQFDRVMKNTTSKNNHGQLNTLFEKTIICLNNHQILHKFHKMNLAFVLQMVICVMHFIIALLFVQLEFCYNFFNIRKILKHLYKQFYILETRQWTTRQGYSHNL